MSHPKTIAFVRADLVEAGEIPPLLNHKGEVVYLDSILKEEFECWQPDNYDGEEFNLFLLDKNHQLFRAMSIDFDYRGG